MALLPTIFYFTKIIFKFSGNLGHPTMQYNWQQGAMGNQHKWDVFSLSHKKSRLRTATGTKTTNLRQIQFANLERLNDCQGEAHFVCFADKPAMLDNMRLLAMSTFTLYNEVINVYEQEKRGKYGAISVLKTMVPRSREIYL